MNLATNALDAMTPNEERELSFGLSVVASAAEVELRDSGPGISLAVLQQIGSPFVTGRPDTVGVGFYTLQRVLKHQGGFAQVYSQMGRGTMIRIHLPLRPRPYESPVPAKLRIVNPSTFELWLGSPAEAPSEALTIGALAVQSGVPETTIRAWERRHGIPKPARLPNGYRIYTQRDLEMVMWLKRQVDTGARIGEAVARLREETGDTFGPHSPH